MIYVMVCGTDNLGKAASSLLLVERSAESYSRCFLILTIMLVHIISGTERRLYRLRPQVREARSFVYVLCLLLIHTRNYFLTTKKVHIFY